MASYAAQTAGKLFLKDHVGSKYPKRINVMYEEVQVFDRYGMPTKKTHKQIRHLPVGISNHDGQILNAVRRRAHRLDESISFLGMKFGVGSIVGLIPGLGDFFDVFMAMMVFRTCTKIDNGLDSWTKLWMILNITMDLFIGFVPILGDIADALYRCNTRNAELLGHVLEKRGQKTLRGDSASLNSERPILEKGGNHSYLRDLEMGHPAYNNNPQSQNSRLPIYEANCVADPSINHPAPPTMPKAAVLQLRSGMTWISQNTSDRVNDRMGRKPVAQKTASEKAHQGQVRPYPSRQDSMGVRMV